MSDQNKYEALTSVDNVRYANFNNGGDGGGGDITSVFVRLAIIEKSLTTQELAIDRSRECLTQDIKGLTRDILDLKSTINTFHAESVEKHKTTTWLLRFIIGIIFGSFMIPAIIFIYKYFLETNMPT